MYWRKRDIKSAVTYLERSMELNPEAGNLWNVGEFFYYAERWEAAEGQAKLVIQLLPNVGLGYAQLAWVSSRIGDVDAVHRNAELAEARNPGLYEFKSLALAFGQISEPAEARRIFELAGAGNESEVPNLGWQFWMHMAVKDYDSAMSYLERAIRDNFPYAMAVGLHQNSDHPDLDPIRSHPKFDELVRQVEIPLDSSD